MFLLIGVKFISQKIPFFMVWTDDLAIILLYKYNLIYKYANQSSYNKIDGLGKQLPIINQCLHVYLRVHEMYFASFFNFFSSFQMLYLR